MVTPKPEKKLNDPGKVLQPPKLRDRQVKKRRGRGKEKRWRLGTSYLEEIRKDAFTAKWGNPFFFFFSFFSFVSDTVILLVLSTLFLRFFSVSA